MRYRPEPAFKHGQAPRVGIVWANLGTPDAPTPSALRRYLAQFLSDTRVVEIPALAWKIILHGIILRVRPAQSAAKYASVWTPEGSPLAVWTQRQAKLLQGYLGERGHAVTVLPAMRYGQPSIESTLNALRAQGAEKILILPCQCHKTARLLAEALELSRDSYQVTFQSRFGKAKWLEPSTEPTLKALAGQGQKRVDVICPGFVADCLETLEEIQMEGKQAFMAAGGKQFHYIPCLNASHEGISALAQIAIEQLAGWPTTLATDPALLAASVSRAREMGAGG
ncbi:MAG: ferrochelatase [Ideonella sp. MAG2]|nr:MAG: ferrochelatase [Ideonella sp. MAG2]